MKRKQRQEQEPQEIGREAVNGADTEQRLQGNQQLQQIANQVWRETGAGAGFLAGQMGHSGNIQAQQHGGRQRSWSQDSGGAGRGRRPGAGEHRPARRSARRT